MPAGAHEAGEITLRAVRAGDYAEIAAIHEAAVRDAYRGIVPAPQIRRLAAYTHGAHTDFVELHRLRRATYVAAAGPGGALVGVATAWVHPRTGRPQLCHTYVLPGWHRRGVGSRLWAARVDFLRRRGYARADVRTLGANERARAFIEAMGGELRAESPIGGGYTECRYRVPLR